MKQMYGRVMVSALVLALLSGCSRTPSEAGISSKSAALMSESAPAVAERKALSDSGAGDSMPDPKRADAQVDGRKLIYTANLTIAVQDIQDAAKKLESQLAEYKAYTASQDWYENSVSFEIKVPVEHFNALLDALGSKGKIRHKNVQARDVTEYYYDLENRVKNKRILVERYQTYLKNAKNVEDLLNVERFLNDATTELESLEGNFRGLVKQVDFATISLTMESQVQGTSGQPTLWERLRNLFVSFGSIVQTGIVIIVALIIYGIPLILVLALLWMLAFGRIGLVKKLFSLMSNRK